MRRVFHSVFVAPVNSLLIVKDRTSAKKLRRTALACVRTAIGRRAVSALLIISLLATSTPAAPQTIVAVAAEWHASLAFWLRTNKLPVTLYRTLTGQNPHRAQPQERQNERDARIARVEIQPGKRTIQVGDRLWLSAIAYDQNNVPLGGVHFQWASNYPSQDQQTGILPHGEFVPNSPGEYAISAEGGGIIATVNVTVVARSAPNKGSASERQPTIRNVSSYSMDQRPNKSSSATALETNAFIDGDPYGWNSTNRAAAFSPLNERGQTPGRSTIEATSSNFRIQAPVISLSGRGLDLDLSLVYNSRVWSKSNNANNEIVFDADKDQVVPGWSLNFGKIINMVDAGAFIVEANGARHSFSGQVTIDPNNGERSFWGNTTDGSFIEYAVLTRGIGTSNVDTYGFAKYPNGLTLSFWGANSIGNTGFYALYTAGISDNNGNYISFTYANGRVLTIVDTLGRVITFHYDSNQLLTAITAAGLKDEAGNVTNRTLVRLHYKQLSLDYAFEGLTPVVGTPIVWGIDAIYYPATKTGHWFGDSDSYSSYGMIRKISERKAMGFSDAPPNEQGTFQAGAVTRETVYDYPLTRIANLTDAPAYHTATEFWEGSTTGQATTQYDVQQSGETRIVTTTAPDQTRTIEYSYVRPAQYDNGLVYKVEIREGGSLLQTTTTTWEMGYQGTPRVKRRDFTDERERNRFETYGYGEPSTDFYNQLKDQNEFDYSGNLLHKTSWTYDNHGYYIDQRLYPGIATQSASTRVRLLHLVTSVEVTAADGKRVSRSEYEYDGYDPNFQQGAYAGDLVNTPSVTNHDGFYDPYFSYFFHIFGGFKYRGNVTKITSYTDAEHLAGPLQTLLTYDITGNVRTLTKNGKQRASSYTLAMQYACPMIETVGSPASNSSTRITTSTTYDFNTGLPLSSTDANSRTTQSTYYLDSWRLKQETAPTGATKLNEYDDAALSGTETTKASDGTIARSSVTRTNGRGQVIRVEALAAPNVWDTVETQYDELARPSKESLPYSVGQPPQWNETFYDALGRIKRVVTADGSESKVFYNEAARPGAATDTPGETARAVDAWGRERWTLIDALGRTIEVVEPDSNGNGSVMAPNSSLTKYSYDALGNLSRVDKDQQVRRFRYDSLGRLTQQKLAEADATLNEAGQRVAGGEWSDVFAYDERSNLILQVDARGVKTNFAYNNDPLDRLQSVACDTSGVPAGETVHPAATITYQYMPTGDVTRVQSVTASNVSTETFGYDAEARLNAKTLVFAGRPSYPALTEYVYDSLDRVTDIHYPVQYGTVNNPRKIVHHDYDVASRPSALKVNDAYYASQIVYNAASQKTSVKVGTGLNQVTEAYDYDPVTALLTGQQVQRAGTTLMDLTYEYLRQGTSAGRTGQLTRIVNNRNRNKDRSYSYDALGRLRQAQGGPESAPLWTQTYNYDIYGNRLSVSAGGHSAWNREFPARHNGPGTQTAKASDPQSTTGDPQMALADGNDKPALSQTFDGSTNVRLLDTHSGEAKSGARATESTGYAKAAAGSTSTSSSHHASRSPRTNALNLQTAPPTFSDDPLNNSQTQEKAFIKAIHITELRDAIDALRARLGAPAYPWQESVSTGNYVKASHISEMRTALDQVLGAPAGGYSTGLGQGLVIQAIHVQELRERVKGAWTSSAQIPRDGYLSLAYDNASNRITTAGFQYDAAGNQTRVVRPDGSAQFYEYDAANRLVKVRDQNQFVIASYAYGETNQRLIAQDGDDNSNQRTYFVWSGASVIAEYVESPSSPTTPRWSKNYVYLGGRLLATQEPDGTSELVQYHHPDRLGTRVVTSSNGSWFEQVTLPYGVAINAESTGATNRRFTSYDHSSLTRLDYAVNRSYDSGQGRFTQVDPLGMGAVRLENPQSLNLYSYCLNDPINSQDPTGTDGIFSIFFPTFPGGGHGGGSIFGAFLGGLFSFGLGLLGTIFSRGIGGILGPFLGGFQGPRSTAPSPPAPTVIAVHGVYGVIQETAHPGNEAFFKRARSTAGGETNIRGFGTGADLIYNLITLSNQVGPIGSLNGFFHSVPAGIVGTTPDNVGLYIDYRPHDVYTSLGSDGKTTGYPLNAKARAAGARGTEDFVNAILEGKINMANGSEIVLWGCNTDAMASHISFLLTAGNRGDIRVTGVKGKVSFADISYAHAWERGGRFNTYTGNRWTGGPSRRTYR